MLHYFLSGDTVNCRHTAVQYGAIYNTRKTKTEHTRLNGITEKPTDGYIVFKCFENVPIFFRRKAAPAANMFELAPISFNGPAVCLCVVICNSKRFMKKWMSDLVTLWIFSNPGSVNGSRYSIQSYSNSLIYMPTAVTKYRCLSARLQ